LPHLHASGEFGLWNEEHDLSLMAALGTAASQLDATPVVGLVPALVLTLALAGARAVSAPLCLTDPRAPPLRKPPPPVRVAQDRPPAGSAGAAVTLTEGGPLCELVLSSSWCVSWGSSLRRPPPRKPKRSRRRSSSSGSSSSR